eukprot:SAG11_NODE_7195_length_1179_cov_4.303704_1_plen_99_part_10
MPTKHSAVTVEFNMLCNLPIPPRLGSSDLQAISDPEMANGSGLSRPYGVRSAGRWALRAGLGGAGPGGVPRRARSLCAGGAGQPPAARRLRGRRSPRRR